MNRWALVALAGGGIFTSGTVYFASSRLRRWHEMRRERFLPDFARTINVADKVQPVLLVVALIATLIFAGAADGVVRTLAFSAASGFASIMIGSLVFFVPLQRRMIKTGADPATALDAMKSNCCAVTWVEPHSRSFPTPC